MINNAIDNYVFKDPTNINIYFRIINEKSIKHFSTYFSLLYKNVRICYSSIICILLHTSDGGTIYNQKVTYNK